MARTINEIANGMKVAFVRNEALRTAFGLTGYDADNDESEPVAYYNENFSAVSVETCLIYVVATGIALLENMMDWFTNDVDTAISRERYGHAGWFENVAKNFQYDGVTDFGLDESTGIYATIVEDAKIIRHASCEDFGYGVKLKVAKGGDVELEPLDSDEKEAFGSYINRLKPAGIPVTIISQPADTLRLKMTVYYDPTIFTGDNALAKVKNVIKQYLTDIDFNGEFVTMTMVDRLQAVPGLDIIEVDEVEAQYAGYEYSRIAHDARYIPVAGYMQLADDGDNEITMIANV